MPAKTPKEWSRKGESFKKRERKSFKYKLVSLPNLIRIFKKIYCDWLGNVLKLHIFISCHFWQLGKVGKKGVENEVLLTVENETVCALTVDVFFCKSESYSPTAPQLQFWSGSGPPWPRFWKQTHSWRLWVENSSSSSTDQSSSHGKRRIGKTRAHYVESCASTSKHTIRKKYN